MSDRLREFVLKHYDNQDMSHVDFRVEAYTLALECDASIADELESAATLALPPNPAGDKRYEQRLRIAVRTAVTALRQRGTI